MLLQDERQKVASAAAELADSLANCRLVVLTRRGVLANQMAIKRPISLYWKGLSTINLRRRFFLPPNWAFDAS